MPSDNRIHGKAALLTIDGTPVDFTSAKPSPKKDYENSTDTGDYDAATGQTFKSQLAGAIGMDLDIDFNFDLTKTGTAILAKLLGDDPVAIVLSDRKTSTTLISGSFDIAEAPLEVDASKIVSGSAKFQSNGAFTFG